MITVTDDLVTVAMHAIAAELQGSKLQLFAGQRPAISGETNTETLIAEINLQIAVEGRFITIDPVGEPLARVQGGASWARVLKADDSWLMDMDAGTENTDLILNNLQFYPGSTILFQQLKFAGV